MRNDLCSLAAMDMKYFLLLNTGQASDPISSLKLLLNRSKQCRPGGAIFCLQSLLLRQIIYTHPANEFDLTKCAGLYTFVCPV